MPTAQGESQLPPDRKAAPGEPEAIYITLADTTCRTRRTWKITEAVRKLQEGRSDGFFISTFCDQCHRGFFVQIVRAKDAPGGFSAMPVFLDAGDAGDMVMDDVGLARRPE